MREWKDYFGNGSRLLSACAPNSGTRIWIIKEADHSVTAVQLREEY